MAVVLRLNQNLFPPPSQVDKDLTIHEVKGLNSKTYSLWLRYSAPEIVEYPQYIQVEKSTWVAKSSLPQYPVEEIRQYLPKESKEEIRKILDAAMLFACEKKIQFVSSKVNGIARDLFAGENKAYILLNEKKDPTLGNGNFKKVKTAIGLHNQTLYALGMSHCWEGFDEEHCDALRHETDIMKELKECDFLVQIEEAFETPQHMYFIMERMDEGSLVNLFQSQIDIPFLDRVRLAMDLAIGLSKMHAKNIIHRDLKADNILLSKEGVAKIGDFGGSCFIQEKRFSHQRTGSLPCIPPENVRFFNSVEELDEEWSKSSDKPADIWSLALIFFSLFHPKMGELLQFQNKDKLRDVISQLSEEQITQELECSGIDYRIQLLLSDMLKIDSKKRISIQEVLKRLQKIKTPS